jgi:hypothetical protein
MSKITYSIPERRIVGIVICRNLYFSVINQGRPINLYKQNEINMGIKISD